MLCLPDLFPALLSGFGISPNSGSFPHSKAAAKKEHQHKSRHSPELTPSGFPPLSLIPQTPLLSPSSLQFSKQTTPLAWINLLHQVHLFFIPIFGHKTELFQHQNFLYLLEIHSIYHYFNPLLISY